MWIAYAHYATDTFIVSVAYTTYVSFCHGHNYSFNEMLAKFQRNKCSSHVWSWLSEWQSIEFVRPCHDIGSGKTEKTKTTFFGVLFSSQNFGHFSTTKTYLTHKIVGPNILKIHVTCPWKVKLEVIDHGQTVFWMGFEFPYFDFKKVYNISVFLERLIL